MSWASFPPPVRTDPASSPRPEATRGWGPGYVAVGVVTLLVATLVEAGFVAGFDPDLKSLGAKLVLQALLAVTLIAVALTITNALVADGTTMARLGLRRPRAGAVKLAVGAYLAYFAFAIAYSAGTQPHQKDITRDLGFGHGALGSIAAGLLIIVAAPVSEEIFFRGFVFGGLRNRMRFLLAGPISAAIFGLFHYTGPGSLTVLPQLAVLGLALAYVYERSGSILPTMAIHALNNAIAFALLTS